MYLVASSHLGPGQEPITDGKSQQPTAILMTAYPGQNYHDHE